MTKGEFLDGLRRALFSTGSDSLINENINYYSSYIDDEIGKGRSEEEVVAELGDPRLIARSIKDAAGISDEIEDIIEEGNSGNTYNSYSKNKQTYTDDYGNEIKRDEESIFRSFNMGRWGCLAGLIITFVVLWLVISVVAYVVGGIMSFLAPVIVPILLLIIVMIFIRIFRNGQ